MSSAQRSREFAAPDILSKRGGVFWGGVLLLVGILWFLNVMEVINLGDKFVEAILPLMFIVGGMWLLVMKVGR
ncbi:MAG: hypothetical protein ACREKH_09190 [Candidatus Rokuibacteriota bacterium]